MSARDLFAVTIIGNDRPGIVAGITKALYEADCNLEDATSTILRGHFSMMLVVTSGSSQEELEDGLRGAGQQLGVTVDVRPVEEAAIEYDEPTHMVSVYGADQPGIVYRISKALEEAGANVTDLTSRVIGEPDQPVYAVMMEVAATDDPTSALKEVAAEIGVEVSVHPIETDVL